MRRFIIIIVYLYIFHLEGLNIISPSNLEGFYNTPVLTNYPLNGIFEPITGLLVTSDASPEDKVGKIVMIFLAENGISWNTEEAQQVEQGAIAIIDVDRTSDMSGNLVYVYSGGEQANRDKVVIPIVTIGKTDGAYIKTQLDKGINITVNITDGDPNPWVEAYTSVYYNVFFVGYISIFSFLCLEKAFTRLIRFIAVQGLSFQIAQFTLFIQCLSNAIRLIDFLVDPVDSRGILSWQAASPWHTITLPLGLMATLSLTLFWHETITRKLSNNLMTFLKKFKIPFIVISALILLLDLAASILRALWFPFTVVTIIEVILFICIILAISIFYFVTGFKILNQINKSKNVRRGTKKSANVTKLVVLSSVGNIIVSVGAVLLGLDAFNVPVLFLVAWGIFHTGLLLTSFIQTLAFVPPVEGEGTSSMGSFNRERISNKFVTE